MVSTEDLPDVPEEKRRIPMNTVLKTWGSETDLSMYVTSFDVHSQDIESHVRAAFKSSRPSQSQPSTTDENVTSCEQSLVEQSASQEQAYTPRNDKDLIELNGNATSNGPFDFDTCGEDLMDIDW